MDKRTTQIAFFSPNWLEKPMRYSLGCALSSSEKFDGVRKLEVTMKKLALAAALTVAASSAFACGMAEPVMEPAVIEAKTTSSAGGIVVPLLLLLVVAAAASK